MIDSTYAECSDCHLTAFEPKPCTECVKGHDITAVYCPTCAPKCPSCGESFCNEHRATSGRCLACQFGEDGQSDAQFNAYHMQGIQNPDRYRDVMLQSERMLLDLP